MLRGIKTKFINFKHRNTTTQTKPYSRRGCASKKTVLLYTVRQHFPSCDHFATIWNSVGYCVEYINNNFNQGLQNSSSSAYVDSDQYPENIVKNLTMSSLHLCPSSKRGKKSPMYRFIALTLRCRRSPPCCAWSTRCPQSRSCRSESRRGVRSSVRGFSRRAAEIRRCARTCSCCSGCRTRSQSRRSWGVAREKSDARSSENSKDRKSHCYASHF